MRCKKLYKVLDLFAGAGGLSLGFHQTGKFEIVAAVEKHPAARLTYNRNKPNVKLIEDVLGINNFEEFRKEYGLIDVIVGGPPCQGFSNANRQKFDLISLNNGLVKKYIEFIEQLKPKAFVMENVAMFKSKVHRFYLSNLENLDRLGTSIVKDRILLYRADSIISIKELKCLGENYETNKFIIDLRLLKDLRLLITKSKNIIKLQELINNRGSQIIKLIEDEILNSKSNHNRFNLIKDTSLQAFIDYIKGDQSNTKVFKLMEDFIEIQRYFYTLNELKQNNISIPSIEIDGNSLYVDVQAITVYDYLFRKLEGVYDIADNVLNAATYGAPQTRKRFIAFGVRKDLLKGELVTLPSKKLEESQYRTVRDAIEDLENEPVHFEVNLDSTTLKPHKCKEGSLLQVLRDSENLHNHVITQSREHSLERFKVLKQGQNFHDLDKSLMSTYTNPARTQNSIYRRLSYNSPAPTVTNVRKSMWIHPTKNRAVSIREAARLQTFPDSFIFMGSKDQQYQQVGNAVPPILANSIAEKVLEYLGD